MSRSPDGDMIPSVATGVHATGHPSLQRISVYRVLGIAGSLRAGSYNRALLRAAIELAPPELEIVTFDRIGELPHYEASLDTAEPPEPVRALREAIAAAQALLIATPEYNFSVPGVLKNAIDWASRPPQHSVLNGKVAGIMGASPGMSGTMRAQLHLRQMFVFTRTWPLTAPEVLVARCKEKFDADGRLVDEATRTVVGTYLRSLADYTRRMAPA